MHLPAQSGKTRKMTDLMNRWDSILTVEGNEENHINIVFTSNSKLLTKQTVKRVVSATEVDDTSESCISELSECESETDNFNGIVNDSAQSNRTIAWISGGGAKTDERMIDQMIRCGDIDNVICCTNKQRMTRVLSLLRLLKNKRDSNPKNNPLWNRTINIWIDEADACMKLWTKQLRTIMGFDTLINKIVLISATMSPVIKYFHKNEIDCNLRVYDTTHAECYVRFSDCNVSHEFSTGNQSAFDHMCAVLDRVPPQPGSRWFCPGEIAKKSHNAIAAELLTRGFNVLILNGDQKKLIFADRSCESVNVMESVSDDVELSDSIRTLYYDYQLDSAPFAVTGNMCISRGITFASKKDHFEFLFTHGIIPDIGSAEEIYQMVARCLGNFREFDSFVNPNLFMTERVASKIANQEHLAIELARRYYNGNDTHVLSSDEFALVANEHPVIPPPRARKPKPQERVPVILSFGPEQEYLYSEDIIRIQTDKVFESLISMISGKPEYTKLLHLIQLENTVRFATAPQEDNSYMIRITQVVNSAEKGTTNKTSVYKKDQDKNICNVFVDKREKRLCIVIWSIDPEVY
jgi:hypothetical protein